MTQRLIILGTGGNAYDVLDVVDAINAARPTWSVAGFLDDARPKGSEHAGLPVLGRVSEAAEFGGHWFVNAIGSDRSYRRRPQIVGSTGVTIDRFATLVHPQACLSARAKLGRGVCVNFGASVSGGATIGDHAWFGPGCVIGHDSVIEDHAIVAPGAIVSGFVRVGAASYIGAGAMIRQQVAVGCGALVGMGTVVLEDVMEGTTVVGNPARELPRRQAVAAGARDLT